jgi:hypothetical protein
MKTASVYADSEQEASRYMWIESEKAGRDLGEAAVQQWVQQHWGGFLRARWLEHLQGKRFWIELDRSDFGLLQREFKDNALLLDRVLDRLMAGQDNLNIISWALDWGMPMDRVVEMLTAIDINSRRLAYQINGVDRPGIPLVTIESAWLVWQEGLVPRLARGIVEEGVFDGLPILGDALEEAGCDNAVILEHCRSGGPHTRGSWLVDLIVWAS